MLNNIKATDKDRLMRIGMVLVVGALYVRYQKPPVKIIINYYVTKSA